MNNNCTRNLNNLDRICANDMGVTVTVCEGPVHSDHVEFECHLSCKVEKGVTSDDKFVFNYRKADFDHLRYQLQLIPWNILDSLEVENCVQIFYDFLYAAIKDSVPIFRVRSRKHPQWYTSDIIFFYYARKVKLILALNVRVSIQIT